MKRVLNCMRSRPRLQTAIPGLGHVVRMLFGLPDLAALDQYLVANLPNPAIFRIRGTRPCPVATGSVIVAARNRTLQGGQFNKSELRKIASARQGSPNRSQIVGTSQTFNNVAVDCDLQCVKTP